MVLRYGISRATKCSSTADQSPCSTAGTHMDIDSEHFKQLDIQFHAAVFRAKALMILYPKYNSKKALFRTVGKKTIVPDLLEAFRKNMLHKAPDEFFVRNGGLMGGVGTVISGPESYGCIGNLFDTGVRYSYAMGVASQVFDGVAKAVEGLLYIWAPILLIK